MPKFITNIVRDFLNIYVEEEDIRRVFGNDYADRYSNIDPRTGKKTVSGVKVITRVFIVFMLLLSILVIARMCAYSQGNF